MCKKNLFIVGTAYQFISAFTICIEEFTSDEYENIIYLVKSSQIDYDLNAQEHISNIVVHRYDFDNRVELIKMLGNQIFSRFFYFHDLEILFKYLAYRLKRNGAIICLGPDGMAPYGEYKKKHEFLSMIKDTLIDYQFLVKNKLILPSLLWSRNYKYGSCVFLDEVWVQYPEYFNAKKHKTEAKIRRIPTLTSNHMEKLASIFKFENKQLSENEKIIFYFNQPLWTDSLINKEFEILQEISDKFPGNTIFIKLHPTTKPFVKERMGKLSYVYLITDKLPAEFYLGLISNSILLTGWSAALMHDINHRNNKYYFLYPLYYKLNDKILSQINIVKLPHIEMVNSIKEIEFTHE